MFSVLMIQKVVEYEKDLERENEQRRNNQVVPFEAEVKSLKASTSKNSSPSRQAAVIRHDQQADCATC